MLNPLPLLYVVHEMYRDVIWASNTSTLFFFSAVSQCSRETDYFLLIENHIEPNEVARVE